MRSCNENRKCRRGSIIFFATEFLITRMNNNSEKFVRIAEKTDTS